MLIQLDRMKVWSIERFSTIYVPKRCAMPTVLTGDQVDVSLRLLFEQPEPCVPWLPGMDWLSRVSTDQLLGVHGSGCSNNSRRDSDRTAEGGGSCS